MFSCFTSSVCLQADKHRPLIKHHSLKLEQLGRIRKPDKDLSMLTSVRINHGIFQLATKLPGEDLVPGGDYFRNVSSLCL